MKWQLLAVFVTLTSPLSCSVAAPLAWCDTLGAPANKDAFQHRGRCYVIVDNAVGVE